MQLRRSKIEEGAVIVDDATTECDQLIRLLGIGGEENETSRLCVYFVFFIGLSFFFCDRIKNGIKNKIEKKLQDSYSQSVDI